MYNMSDILVSIIDAFDTVEKENTSTEKGSENKVSISKETLKALISEEVAKQVGDKYLCLSKKVKELQKKVEKLEDWTQATDEQIYGIYEELSDVWDSLDFKDYENYCDDEYCDEEDLDEEDEDPDAELEAIVKLAKEEDSKKHDDYSGEEFLSKVAKDHFGLDSYTISDGDKSALVVPLDEGFDLMHYLIKQEVSTLISEINKRSSK